MIVTVAWATLEVQDVVPVEAAPGATVADAVRDSGLVARYGLEASALRYARFGARVEGDACLAPGDRIDLVRALIADPKAARAQRARAKASSGTAPRAVRRNTC